MSNGGTVSVTATILGNTIVDVQDVPWTSGMNAQQALEAAYNTQQDANYGFSLSYYGSTLGYLVEEIEQIGDQPGVYWEFFLNGASSDVGIDFVVLDAGDAVSFEYQYYAPSRAAAPSPQIAAKQQRRAVAR